MEVELIVEDGMVVAKAGVEAEVTAEEEVSYVVIFSFRNIK